VTIVASCSRCDRTLALDGDDLRPARSSYLTVPLAAFIRIEKRRGGTMMVFWMVSAMETRTVCLAEFFARSHLQPHSMVVVFASTAGLTTVTLPRDRRRAGDARRTPDADRCCVLRDVGAGNQLRVSMMETNSDRPAISPGWRTIQMPPLMGAGARRPHSAHRNGLRGGYLCFTAANGRADSPG
jgi:hypothetical protein